MKTILIDLDGVLNTYNGNYDEHNIPPVKDGAEEFLRNLSQNYQLKLFTTRNQLLASKWLLENKLDKYFVDITNIKEPCWLYVDDRCVRFDGDYEDLTKRINEFQVWFKK